VEVEGVGFGVGTKGDGLEGWEEDGVGSVGGGRAEEAEEVTLGTLGFFVLFFLGFTGAAVGSIATALGAEEEEEGVPVGTGGVAGFPTLVAAATTVGVFEGGGGGPPTFFELSATFAASCTSS